MKKEITKGFKLTPQRIAILDYLKGTTDHPSAEDVYKALSQKFPTTSLATVYNTLDTLKTRGEVTELTIDSNKKRFDPNTTHHHHLICIRCKKITDIHIDYDLTVPPKNRKGFEIVGNHIEFYGICPDCKSKR